MVSGVLGINSTIRKAIILRIVTICSSSSIALWHRVGRGLYDIYIVPNLAYYTLPQTKKLISPKIKKVR